MADDTRLPLGTEDGDTYASDDISNVKYQRVKVTLGADGVTDGDVSSANPLPVTGTITATTGGLTDTQLRATAVPISVAAAQTLANVTTVGTITNVVHVDDNSGSLTVDAVSLPLPSLAATSTKQSDGTQKTQVVDGSGNVIAATSNALNVNVANASLTVASHAVTNAGVFAVQAAEADGANVTLGAKADAKSTATDTTAVTAMQVLKQISASVQAPPSQAVTNAGTFAAQVTGCSAPDATSTYAPTNATSTAYETNRVIKGSAGVLFCVTGYNSKTAQQFIQLHNASSLPGDGGAPVITFIVPASSNFSLNFGGKFGRYFSTGIVICNSSSGATKTIGSADCWFDAQYV